MSWSTMVAGLAGIAGLLSLWLMVRLLMRGEPKRAPSFTPLRIQPGTDFLCAYPFNEVLGQDVEARLRERWPQWSERQRAERASQAIEGLRNLWYLWHHQHQAHPGTWGIPSVLVTEAWMAFRHHRMYGHLVEQLWQGQVPNFVAPDLQGSAGEALRRTARAALCQDAPREGMPMLWTLDDGVPEGWSWTPEDLASLATEEP